MRSLLVGAMVVFGIGLGLDVAGTSYTANTDAAVASSNADAAMTPDSGTSGIGYGTE